MKLKKELEVVKIDKITFDDFIKYGKANCDHLTNNYPWSFDYKGHPVTHENDMCYIVPTLNGTKPFTPNDVIITNVNGDLSVLSIDEFNNMKNAVK